MTQKLLDHYLREMIAVESELHAAFRRQRDDDKLRAHRQSAALVDRIEQVLDRHLEALRQKLESKGETESTFKTAIGSIMGAAAGVYDKLRSERVSRMLRDDYTAISLATVCYEMLHASALAAGDQELAELAIRHLSDYTPLVMEISETIPFALVEELSVDGKLPANRAAAEQAVANTKKAWQAGAHETQANY
jgi:hypothetical protein